MMAMADGRRLEARFAPATRSELVVLCHPHPLFGGSMDNAVVLALRDVFWAAGIGTLRFNYRGVGQSEGSYGGGGGRIVDRGPPEPRGGEERWRPVTQAQGVQSAHDRPEPSRPSGGKEPVGAGTA